MGALYKLMLALLLVIVIEEDGVEQEEEEIRSLRGSNPQPPP